MYTNAKSIITLLGLNLRFKTCVFRIFKRTVFSYVHSVLLLWCGLWSSRTLRTRSDGRTGATAQCGRSGERAGGPRRGDAGNATVAIVRCLQAAMSLSEVGERHSVAQQQVQELRERLRERRAQLSDIDCLFFFSLHPAILFSPPLCVSLSLSLYNLSFLVLSFWGFSSIREVDVKHSIYFLV